MAQLFSLPTLLLLFLIPIIAAAATNSTSGLTDPFLAPHNAVRSALGLPLMVWDPRLARYAEAFAWRRRADCALVHSSGPYGENLFWGSGTGWAPSQAVAAWAAERRWYQRRTNACMAGKQCGHYTQIVWRDTRRLGCSSVQCLGDRGQLIVCEYDPPGNYIGERPY
ncbi:hypothetical protein HPP92_017995 [Vanilla planifolia]|uniref:SCP domain-containing protein n=1 Tax=Vanilla planifolia TaxID=51239 RepID=A0A835UNZ0_VANPL|nr:hypothetical protein HPP92_017995 [Vanilla planifolia]